MKKFRTDKSTILTTIGVLANLGSTITSSVAAVKAHEAIQNAKCETKKDKLKTGGKYYIPTALLQTVSIGCEIGSLAVSKKNEEKLLAAALLATTTLTGYRKVTTEMFGEEADQKIMEEVKKLDKGQLYSSHPEYHEIGLEEADKKAVWVLNLLPEEHPEWKQSFVAYEREIMDAKYHILRNYVLGGWCISVEEIYKFFGLKPPKQSPEEDWCCTDFDGDILGIEFCQTYLGEDPETGLEMYEISLYWGMQDIGEMGLYE